MVLRENQGRVRGKLTTLRSPVEAGFCDPVGALEDTGTHRGENKGAKVGAVCCSPGSGPKSLSSPGHLISEQAGGGCPQFPGNNVGHWGLNLNLRLWSRYVSPRS